MEWHWFEISTVGKSNNKQKRGIISNRRRFFICDRSEQKQPFGWVLTNPLHVTPLRPDSTVIDGFSKLIPQRIAVEISYLLVYCFWKSINNCGAGTQWRNVWWIRQDPPKRLLLLGAVTYALCIRTHKIFIYCKSQREMLILYMWPLRAKATVWVEIDESTTRYAIASRLNIYWWIFMGNTPKDSWFQQLSFEVSIVKIRQ